MEWYKPISRKKLESILTKAGYVLLWDDATEYDETGAEEIIVSYWISSGGVVTLRRVNPHINVEADDLDDQVSLSFERTEIILPAVNYWDKPPKGKKS